LIKWLKQRVEGKPTLFGSAASKAHIFRDRYDLIKQRILRNDQFKPPVIYRDEDGGDDVYRSHQHPQQQPQFIQLTPIKNLLGYEGRTFYLFGMLAQLKQGEWYLEDPDADVRLDLSDAAISPGIFTETSFVMVNGVYQDNHSFKVLEMVQPPPENRQDSMYDDYLTPISTR
jgi:DNA polymerase epsilon subunit 2